MGKAKKVNAVHAVHAGDAVNAVDAVNAMALGSPEQLRKIDQLREMNVGTHMDLPQLVVVGDQSSGKSSLLESVTRIPFPSAQGLCTRYATQITHRRDYVEDVVVTIIPGPDVSVDEKESLSSFRRSFATTAELHEQFASILNEVNALMGIKMDNNPDGKKTFSRDILRIEKCGPDEDYLTIIDVPGIFRNTEEGVTTETDKNLVLDMVKSYIKQERTIILAVLPCTVDIMTQEVLNLAKTYDPAGERTLGVLTKPDLLVERSTKAVVCELVNGQKKPLNLGYFVVRNRGADEDAKGHSGTQERESMFKEEPWCHLPSDRVGVDALRLCLQDLLVSITNKAFPKLRQEAEKKFAFYKDSLNNLGAPRQTKGEQRRYLSGLAHDFQNIVRDALSTNYANHPSLDSNEVHLATNIVNASKKFRNAFMAASNCWKFNDQDRDDIELDIAQFRLEQHDVSILEELDASIDLDWAPSVPEDGITDWIESKYQESRGFEMGTLAASVLHVVFREQSKNWDLMAKLYLSNTIVMIHRFIMTILKTLCHDSNVLGKLRSTIKKELIKKYDEAMKQAMKQAKLERDRKPYTFHQSFEDLLERSRRSQQISGGTDAKQQIYDILYAYYKVARERFVDNLFRHAVDDCLLTGDENPLSLFSEQWVLDLSKENLAIIAGEPRRVASSREQLKKKIEDLKAALDILR